MRRNKIITTAFIHHLQFVLHRQRIQEFCNFLIHRHRKRDRKYSACQLKFLLATASEYSKQIKIVPIASISVTFVRQFIKYRA